MVAAQSYWLQLSRYIHRNPLEAKLCKSLSQYRWSSYRAYIGEEKAPLWLTTDYILNAIGTRNVHERYKKYVNQAVDVELEEFYDRKKLSPILGDDAFNTHGLEGKPQTVDIPELAKERVLPTLDQGRVTIL